MTITTHTEMSQPTVVMSPVSTLLVTVLLAAVSTFTMAASDADEQMPITLQFAGEFAGQPFDCHRQFESVGVNHSTVTVSEFKLYVSNVQLIDEAGERVPLQLDNDDLWQQANVALLDFESGDGHCSNGTAQTNTTIMGQAPKGRYTGVAFDVGVPFEMNHVDPTLAASPMNLTSMFWNWRGGYRFMRVDLAVVGDTLSDMAHEKVGEQSADNSGHNGMKKPMKGHGGGRGWAVHVGSTGCEAVSPTHAPSSCRAPNRVSVAFNGIDLADSTLVVDPGQLLAASDVTANTPDTAPGCMSSPGDPECLPIFERLGLAPNAGTQVLVSVR